MLHKCSLIFRFILIFVGNITPTVELNALAMKRGEPTIYTFVELPSFPPTPNTYNYQRGLYTQVSQVIFNFIQILYDLFLQFSFFI